MTLGTPDEVHLRELEEADDTVREELERSHRHDDPSTDPED